MDRELALQNNELLKQLIDKVEHIQHHQTETTSRKSGRSSDRDGPFPRDHRFHTTRVLNDTETHHNRVGPRYSELIPQFEDSVPKRKQSFTIQKQLLSQSAIHTNNDARSQAHDMHEQIFTRSRQNSKGSQLEFETESVFDGQTKRERNRDDHSSTSNKSVASQQTIVTQQKLHRMSMQGSLVGNFLMKKVKEDIETRSKLNKSTFNMNPSQYLNQSSYQIYNMPTEESQPEDEESTSKKHGFVVGLDASLGKKQQGLKKSQTQVRQYKLEQSPVKDGISDIPSFLDVQNGDKPILELPMPKVAFGQTSTMFAMQRMLMGSHQTNKNRQEVKANLFGRSSVL
ncbi:hypothetical protein FGO68_gene7162 [Halteria grandinella]|uniref:Uncharacterized protein n=1 Tax=Halteria grandinella TaxID=5974 RepID=A0A8J8NCS0_HALGN|nr:hypothetical protein FGO68_gene7162 [Halteria grandinella]